jgi:hypothetical protein
MPARKETTNASIGLNTATPRGGGISIEKESRPEPEFV